MSKPRPHRRPSPGPTDRGDRWAALRGAAALCLTWALAGAANADANLAIRRGDWQLRADGEVRWRFQGIDNPVWGEEDDEAAFLQRYMVAASFAWRDRLAAVVELRSTFADGRANSPSPVDEDQLDLAQGYIELSLPATAQLLLRLGRQEIRLGSQRLIAVREGPNNRRRFDGVRADVRARDWSVTAVAAYLAEDERGVFDDGVDSDVAVWGLYATREEILFDDLSADVYYLGFHDSEAAYQQGSGRETRHTIGTRIWGASANFDWNWEAAYQFGSFAGSEIRAWTLATDTGYRLPGLAWSPRLAINTNIASGDRDANDDRLETFNPLFPRGNYFSHLALLGPRNFFNVHPGVTLAPLSDLELAFDTNLFWRLERADALYGPPGNLLRPGGTTSERFVGVAVSASIGWQVHSLVRLESVYTHVFPGEFVSDTGPSEDIDFIEATIHIVF